APTAATVRQAARHALTVIARTGIDAEYGQIIRDACRQVTRGYPGVTPELLHTDVHLELQAMTDIRDLRRVARSVARLALTRRMTADAGHGLGGEGDARRGGGGLAQYLRQLTDDTRTGAQSIQRA